MERYIEIPSYIEEGIKPVTNGFYKNNVNVIGCDIESRPYQYLGFRHQGKEKIVNIKNEKKRLKIFLLELEKIAKTHEINLAFFHYLKFDLQYLLLNYKELFRDYDFTINFGKESYMRIYTKSPFFAKIYYSKNKSVFVIDSFAFFRTSLENTAEHLQLKHRKTHFDFDGNESRQELIEYLRNDIRIQEELSYAIVDFHKLYDVRISVSIAQLSARIFKKKFMLENSFIPLPTHHLQGIIKSYHGGKNGFYFDKVERINDIRIMDVNSMYPKAMLEIPNFNRCRYDYINYFDKSREGVYKVYGWLKGCKYPIFYTHDFKPIVKDTYLDGLWITSYELKEAIRTNEFRLQKCIGIVIEETTKYNPLKEFVNYFYKKKNTTPKDSPLYYFYKTILNSLYGKFIQNTVNREEIFFNPENNTYTRIRARGYAGGLFNPLIATLITGYSRSHMHKLEHEYNSLHTATDSIITRSKEIEDSRVIGKLHLELEGDIILFRNKCYIAFPNEPIIKLKRNMPEHHFIKYANHGFYSDIWELIKLYINKDNEYEYEHMANIRESLCRVDKKLKPCEMNKIKSEFKVKW